MNHSAQQVKRMKLILAALSCGCIYVASQQTQLSTTYVIACLSLGGMIYLIHVLTQKYQKTMHWLYGLPFICMLWIAYVLKQQETGLNYAALILQCFAFILITGLICFSGYRRSD